MSLVTTRLHTVNSCYKGHPGQGGGGGTVKEPFALTTLVRSDLKLISKASDAVCLDRKRGVRTLAS